MKKSVYTWISRSGAKNSLGLGGCRTLHPDKVVGCARLPQVPQVMSAKVKTGFYMVTRSDFGESLTPLYFAVSIFLFKALSATCNWFKLAKHHWTVISASQLIYPQTFECPFHVYYFQGKQKYRLWITFRMSDCQITSRLVRSYKPL